MANPPPNIDPQTGEVRDCPNCIEYENEIAGLRRGLRSQEAIIRKLRSDPEADARNSEYWPLIGQLFDLWRRETGHTRSEFTLDRFEVALPYVKKYGEEVIMRAIKGLAYDPYTTTRRNGTVKRHDGWTTPLFKSADHVEEFANCCPRQPGQRAERAAA